MRPAGRMMTDWNASRLRHNDKDFGTRVSTLLWKTDFAKDTCVSGMQNVTSNAAGRLEDFRIRR